ncbi:MAG: FAD-dependent oxidoreductase [Erysipelotrichaceae bacterium]|nr:FAD-dependent oxidoreductase [Erysipelotrichaceae bacterium]
MDKLYDVIVVGGGPAGLTAAIYALRNGKSVLVIEKAVFGGQIVNSPKVENIPGFAEVSGDDFGDMMLNQVTGQGGEVMFDEVLKVESSIDEVTVYLDLGEPVRGKCAILATGTTHRTLNLPNEEGLIGKSIHFCAVCDGNFYKGKRVVMIGGGNSAFVETSHLVDLCEKVIMLQDLEMFTAEKKLQDAVLKRDNVETHVNTRIMEYVLTDGKLSGVKYLENGLEKTANCDGVFLAVGLIPDNDRFTNVADLDERGYFRSDEYGLTRTNNIFVAGDCRSKKLRQVATACSDGANAAIEACRYLG